MGAAILVGDALLALAYDVLAASGHPAAQDAVETLSAAVFGMIEGQYADLSFESRAENTVGQHSCDCRRDGDRN